MTDELIIKNFRNGVYKNEPMLFGQKFLESVLDLINRQAAEIENLKQIIDEEDKEILKLQKRIIFWREDLNYQPEKIKSEAIKEFAERLKETAYSYSDISGYRSTVVDADSIDNLAKKMMEADK